jgi:hypothetical protein
MSNVEPTRGVVDRFEGEYAVVILDDGQQLDWPRAALPPEVRPGVAVVLNVTAQAEVRPGALGEEAQAGAAQGWAGELVDEPGGWVIRLPDGQALDWKPQPGILSETPAEQPVMLRLEADAEDTAARRRRVAGLLDDIFGSQG